MEVDFDQLAYLFNSGHYAELERRAASLLQRYPTSGLTWKLLCASLQMQGKDALQALQNTAEFLPNDTEAHSNLGSALQDLGQLEGAVASYRRAIKISPRAADVYNSLGTALHDLRQLEEAVTSYRQALKTKSNFAEAHNNLGIALQDMGQLDGAMASYHRALEINPNYAEAHNNLGTALRDLGQFDDALVNYRRALEIKNDYAEAHSNYAYLLLALGDFESGWKEYEWRLTSAVREGSAVDPRTKSPLPKASSLLPFLAQGERILLFHEQGIGDELFFLRFVPHLRQEAQSVHYLPTDKMRSLIERSGCVDQVISQTDIDLPFDSVFRVGDLPLLLGCNSTKTIPRSLRLSPTEQSVTKVRHHLSELGVANQRLLGVTWRAGSAPLPGMPRGLFKQVELDLLADSIQGWNGVILVLQREPVPGEIDQLRAKVLCPVYDLSDYNNDLESMLALLDVLDEYVGVSNANMHLMAGLNKRARVLIPSPAEWRWMASGVESPWFPGFKLYRQMVAGDWGQALDALTRDLSHPG